MKEDVEVFKNELKSYKRYLQQRQIVLDLKMVNDYKKTGVSAIRYDKIPVHSSEEAREQYRLSLIEKGTTIEKELERLNLQIEHIENMLKSLPKELQKPIYELLVENKTYVETASGSEIYWSPSGLFKTVERELEKYNIFK